MLSGTNLRKQSSLGNIQSSQHGRQSMRQSKSEPATTSQLPGVDAKAQRRCTTGSLKHTTSLSRSTNSSGSHLKQVNTFISWSLPLPQLLRIVCSDSQSIGFFLQEIWRPPGNCEIPDILGKAFLKPALMPSELATTLRAYNPSKNVSKVPGHSKMAYLCWHIPQFHYTKVSCSSLSSDYCSAHGILLALMLPFQPWNQ